MSNENAYAAPQSALIDQGVLSVEEGDKALAIAKRQRTLIYAFLVYLILAAISGIAGGPVGYLFQILVILVAIAIVIFTARLCLKVYNVVTAVIFIILSFIPVLNILVLLAASGRANQYLKNAGFKVGFMGADVRAIEDSVNALIR